MTNRVKVPEGCYGLQMQDGTRYDADKAGGVVDGVQAHHVDAINKAASGNLLKVGGEGMRLATKRGRVCYNCQPRRIWNAWTDVCNRCGHPTVEE